MINYSFWEPIQLSLFVATISIIIVVISGIGVSWYIANNQFKGKTMLETIIMLPLVLPPTVVGFILVIIFGIDSPIGKVIDFIFDQPVMFTVTAAIIAAVVVSFPLMYQSAKTGFQTIDKNIEDAAKVDGASTFEVFKFISIPLSYKAIMSGAILSFARALGEFGATIMFAGNIPGKTQTIPTAIYVAFEAHQMTLAWAWVISIVIISYLLLYIVRRTDD